MKNLRKILGWVLYLSIMCATISGLIIVLWGFPETSFLVELFKISALITIASAISFVGVNLYIDLN